MSLTTIDGTSVTHLEESFALLCLIGWQLAEDAHLLDERSQLFEGEIGPLAGDQGDRSWHGGGSEGEERRRVCGVEKERPGEGK